MSLIKLEDVLHRIYSEPNTSDKLYQDINSLPQYNPEERWIPVTERLPEEGCYLAFSELIDSALKLTGKTMEDMEEVSGVIYQQEELTYRFSIEKFCYYLLSPEFVEKYSKTINGEFFFDGQEERVARMFGLNIYRFQSGDEEPLIDLLSKIGN